MTTRKFHGLRAFQAVVLAGIVVLMMAPAPVHAQQAPWLTADVRAVTDDQPRDALLLRIEYGRYLTPDVTIAARALAERIESRATVEPGLTGTLAIPSARIGAALTASAQFGAPGGGIELLGDARVSRALGAGTALRARFSRDRYTATLASLDTVVLAHGVEFAIDRAGAPGWAGELLVRREMYGDDNPVSTAFVWLLAPLSRAARHSLRAGYAAGWQDAAQSNWVPDDARRGPPRGPLATSPDSIPGSYAPYYTPHDVITHSVLANAAVELRGAWLILDGAYGVYATELAPVLQRGTGGDVERLYHRRTFSPARAKLTLAVPLGAMTSFTAEAEHQRTAYFRQTGVRIAVARSLGGS
ncbi:hypothetical protein BH23GEM10_BH23GEM10_01410 [soil metagenome]